MSLIRWPPRLRPAPAGRERTEEAPLPATTVGFFGKIPSRGDFVQRALPRQFTMPLESWWQTALHDGYQQLGRRWTELWMVAPVWRFLLPPGVCGDLAAAGLWLPSIDRAGRFYPLTFALVSNRWAEVTCATPFLDAAQEIGVRAVADDIEPDTLAESIAAIGTWNGGCVDHGPDDGCLWWTEGGPFVAPAVVNTTGLPKGLSFGAMLCNGPMTEPI